MVTSKRSTIELLAEGTILDVGSYVSLLNIPERTKADWYKIPVVGPLIRIDEAARFLGIGTSTFYEQSKQGEAPPYIKVGKRASAVPKSWLDVAIALRVFSLGSTS